MAQYFYDGQIRRFMIQFAKMFSDWYVTRGNDPDGNPILVRIPIQYGDSSRMVASIQANNSPSSLPSAPMLTYYISGLEYDQSRTQEPFFVDRMQVRQRKYNSDTNSFEGVQGQAFTIERPMPVPYKLNMTLDFWSTNYNQKLEFFEQVGTLFNPSWEIQSNDNYIDWTSLSIVTQDGLTFTSRQVPAGTGNNIDILTWKFYIPIWLSQPVRMVKQNVINKIINSIHSGKALNDMQDDDLLLGTRQKITPYGYKLLLIDDKLQVYPNNTAMTPQNTSLILPEPQDTQIMWSAFLNIYGAVRPGISQIWLQNPYMETEIVGTINFDPTDDRLLIYNIDNDTLPQNTLQEVKSVINPLLTVPQIDTGPNANNRYLIVEDIGKQSSRITIPGTALGGISPLNDLEFTITSVDSGGSITSIDNFIGFAAKQGNYIVNVIGSTTNAQIVFNVPAVTSTTSTYSSSTATIASGGSGFSDVDSTITWGNLVANANDIIQWNGTKWVVAFDSQQAAQLGNIEYIRNLTTGVQYRYTDGMWMKSVEGWYSEGDYSIVI